MKWIARSFVFVTALVSGAFIASLFSSNTVLPYPQIRVVDEQQTYRKTCRYR